MRQRTQRRKRKRAENAVVRGDEPPDFGISAATAAIIAASIGGAASIATPFIAKAAGPKAPAMPKLGATKSPLAGQPTGLTPGQKVNAINTTPQGLLEPASTARNTLLGN